MTFTSRIGDLLGGGLALLLGVWYLFQAFQLKFWTAGGNPGAGFMPTALGVALILLSLILIGKAWRERASAMADVRAPVDPTTLKRPLLILATLVGYVVLFPHLGYVPTSIGLIGFLLWAFDPAKTGRLKVVRTLAVSIGVVVFFYLLFVVALRVDIPPWPALLG